MDAVIDFGYSTTTNVPGLSGTSFDVVDGTVYPAAPFDVILYLPGTQPLKATAERGRCTAVSGNTLTVTRDLGGTNQNVQAGWAVDNALTAELLEQITSAIPSPATTVTGPDAFGAAAVVGTGTEYARIDHDHGLPAAPADIPLSTVTAAGDLIVGSGAGAVSRLGIGANGDVLTVAAGALGYAAPAAGALTYETGVLSAAVSIPANAWTTILTTPSLATGVWLIVINALIYPVASPSAIEQWGVGYNQSGPGTATVTTLMGGGQSNVWMPIGAPASSGSAASGRHVGLLQVTAAGTILIQMYSPVAANAAISGNETSFQAIKIA